MSGNDQSSIVPLLGPELDNRTKTLVTEKLEDENRTAGDSFPSFTVSSESPPLSPTSFTTSSSTSPVPSSASSSSTSATSSTGSLVQPPSTILQPINYQPSSVELSSSAVTTAGISTCEPIGESKGRHRTDPCDKLCRKRPEETEHRSESGGRRAVSTDGAEAGSGLGIGVEEASGSSVLPDLSSSGDERIKELTDGNDSETTTTRIIAEGEGTDPALVSGTTAIANEQKAEDEEQEHRSEQGEVDSAARAGQKVVVGRRVASLVG
ncbi:uncharacterized protein DDB_G0271670-like [Anopheles funestus]|uniref:uncharacterized protein DDB_G0271670-like n=1 Tax=Anopheles funestus TaxID=62324 RepID=UPI0020C6EABC|nr:uncharacterized protein DDB_G0271670-like [Anopheles funestus]